MTQIDEFYMYENRVDGLLMPTVSGRSLIWRRRRLSHILSCQLKL